MRLEKELLAQIRVHGVDACWSPAALEICAALDAKEPYEVVREE